jgi:uncharacterized membrane protein YuzA (DUF378 family)
MCMQKKIFMVAMVLVLVGALNWGVIGTTNINLVEKLSELIKIDISKFIYIAVGLSALYLMLQRDTYLPFLGDAVYPCGALKEKIPNDHTHEVLVKVPPNSNVVYWASEPENKELEIVSNPWDAYHKYGNSGVVKADEQGNAVLKFRDPKKYKVPGGRILNEHVHYRYCKSPGMLSRIYTVNI